MRVSTSEGDVTISGTDSVRRVSGSQLRSALGLRSTLFRVRVQGVYALGSAVGRAEGDFNGDGKEDVALFYNYGAGNSGLWTFQAKQDGSGGFEPPTARWYSCSGCWEWERSKMT